MKKKGEFSKRIIICVTVGVISITIFACYMIWKTNDLSPLSYLIPSVFVEFATATGFYYDKAKRENLIKIQKGGEVIEEENSY